MECVAKERVNEKWVNTFFEDELSAKTLYQKIKNTGGLVICIRNAQ